MNPLVTRFNLKWTYLTLRHPWTTALAGTNVLRSQVQLSTLPSEPVVPVKKPFKVELIGGKRYSWCACGHSKNQPFCDGAHKTKAQGLSPLRFVPEKDATAWLCGCKYSKKPPYCDGTHKQAFIVTATLHDPKDS